MNYNVRSQGRQDLNQEFDTLPEAIRYMKSLAGDSNPVWIDRTDGEELTTKERETINRMTE